MSNRWKEIKGYERYRVSDEGVVFSTISNQIKKSFKDKKGYMRVQAYKEGKPYTFKVHRLVAQHFIPNFDNKPQINHKDGDKTNNHWMNLEWITNKENYEHARGLGLSTRNRLVWDLREQLAYAKAIGYQIHFLAQALNTTTTTINRAIQGLKPLPVELDRRITSCPRSKYYYYDSERKKFVVDAKSLGVRRKQFKTKDEAEDFVHKLQLRKN